MKLRFACREEPCPALIEYRPKGDAEESFSCPRCSQRYTVHQADKLVHGHAVQTCSLCGGQEFHIRKNFPQKLGLLIVLLAAVISIISLKTHPLLAYGILAGAVVADVIIYSLIGVVTVCYRCRTEYWGVQRNAKHTWFDLSTSEKYL